MRVVWTPSWGPMVLNERGKLMTDDEFVKLNSGDAYDYAFRRAPEEQVRLLRLYKDRVGIEPVMRQAGAISSKAGVYAGSSKAGARSATGATSVGWPLVGLGLLVAAWGFIYEPSSDGDVVNLGMLATKQLIFQSGAVLFLSGVFTIAVAGLRADLRSLMEGGSRR